jgi:hypothetical protein
VSIGRTILVIEERPYLWAALRPRVDPALAYVRGATPAEVSRVWATCEPWPWLLVGATPVLPPGLAGLLGSRPIPVHWLDAAPTGLPCCPVVHGDWTDLVAALDALTRLAEPGVNGARLLRNRGLRAPDGRIVLGVVNLEGLLAAPDGLALPDDAAAAVQAEIAASGLPLRLERTGDLVRLI